MPPQKHGLNLTWIINQKSIVNEETLRLILSVITSRFVNLIKFEVNFTAIFSVSNPLTVIYSLLRQLIIPNVNCHQDLLEINAKSLFCLSCPTKKN